MAANPTTVDHRAKVAQLTRLVRTSLGRFGVPKSKTSSQSYTAHKDCDTQFANRVAAGYLVPDTSIQRPARMAPLLLSFCSIE
ncbi:hypothetical protein BDQ94DRAFT_62474 [Aspergillus welwitschiae]|uniref:Uncharacterized protein n=1 Tax=Aspergillus welwitschiae TaxID=1341132 RepID=A0A3F3PWN0_9EURO|nr:hypothetical protein BDQ94DRAFT_62474 [Aspergillus welwitschiae]RDH31162.1 hypothetical protein BDQ94DRAFT_62474 [Aspergillus welwitschiae]